MHLIIASTALILSSQVSPYSAYLHDAVLLYAMALKEVLKDGKDPHDGQQLLQRLKNKTIRFYGKKKNQYK